MHVLQALLCNYNRHDPYCVCVALLISAGYTCDGVYVGYLRKEGGPDGWTAPTSASAHRSSSHARAFGTASDSEVPLSKGTLESTLIISSSGICTHNFPLAASPPPRESWPPWSPSGCKGRGAGRRCFACPAHQMEAVACVHAPSTRSPVVLLGSLGQGSSRTSTAPWPPPTGTTPAGLAM